MSEGLSSPSVSTIWGDLSSFGVLCPPHPAPIRPTSVSHSGLTCCIYNVCAIPSLHLLNPSLLPPGGGGAPSWGPWTETFLYTTNFLYIFNFAAT